MVFGYASSRHTRKKPLTTPSLLIRRQPYCDRLPPHTDFDHFFTPLRSQHTILLSTAPKIDRLMRIIPLRVQIRSTPVQGLAQFVRLCSNNQSKAPRPYRFPRTPKVPRKA